MYGKAGKSSKMSENGYLSGVKCPQSYVGENPQKFQLSLILPPFEPQILFLSLITTLKKGL
jgi:hypothetical protein